MRLVKSENNACVAASIAMLTGCSLSYVHRKLYPKQPEYPFPPPWELCPLVPSMEQVCEWILTEHGIALTPFQFDPKCTPHEDCPPIPVYDMNPMAVFERQLDLGKGLLEGMHGDKGHMCAWSGDAVYDPHGYIYSLNIADKFCFKPTRFWLASCRS